MPAYRELLGTLLAMWANAHSYRAVLASVTPASQIDPAVFAAYPELQLTYDGAAQSQTLTYRGVLTDATRGQLAGLLPASTVLATLLHAVRDQAVQWFQAQAAGLLTATAADLDAFAQPFLGSDDARQRTRVKAELVRVFLPLLAQKLSRQLVLQSLATNLGADPSLTGALLTDAGLLADPNRPGKSLLGSFLAVRQTGVSASYFASADGSGTASAAGVLATVDTADATNPDVLYAGAGSAHYEGYFEVPTDGPYRFFATLGNQGASVVFQVDSPDPKALLKNPILPSTAATQDNAEVSQFVQLKGGVPYHFAVDCSALGANGARLLIQGETLPKGPLNQVLLYPHTAVRHFAQARALLSKVLQLLGGMGLDEREVNYLTAHAAQFGDLNWSALPTQASDDAPDKAAHLYAWFLALADYADLRKGPAGGSDGLIDVFEHVGATFTEPPDATHDPATPWRRLADLTRRDPQVVRDVARSLGLLQEQAGGQVRATDDFGNTRGIRRLWEALHLVQVTGIPVASLTASPLIASLAPPAGALAPEAIAADLKNAVKARYPLENWRPIAQSIFDPLRRKKRDALVAYLVFHKELHNAEQLFEYLLVDPGMEPVVQTSRLRLALSSVQTFVQRCFLNLENGDADHPERNVAPGAIDPDWWAWMKRFRVWQANREIFLFPENWMEPELRLDKSDLFQALESAVLQGDVTRDLVEDAFLTYLQGLDLRARLDVVALYLDQPTTHEKAQPGEDTLHVIGRTYGRAHQYFYRTHAHGAWSAWEQVTPKIDGDHIIAVVWRGRLNLFWLTFMMKGTPGAVSDAGDIDHITDLTFDQLASKIASAEPQRQIQVQLHWSEYFQGKWSNPIATDMTRYDPIPVSPTFDPRTDVYVHVSKDVDAGEEGPVWIRLDLTTPTVKHTAKGPEPATDHLYYAFRVAGKNGDPDFTSTDETSVLPMPYVAPGIDATLHTGVWALLATFKTAIAADGSGTTYQEAILLAARIFALLTCANPVVPPFLDPGEPLYHEAGGLVSPFFFKDASYRYTRNELTFFVQPTLSETTVDKYQGWAITSAGSDVQLLDPDLWERLPIEQQVPGPHPGPIGPDPESLFSMQSMQSMQAMQAQQDWATSPATAIAYGDALIGQAGGIADATQGQFTVVGKQGVQLEQLNQLLSLRELPTANTVTPLVAASNQHAG